MHTVQVKKARKGLDGAKRAAKNDAALQGQVDALEEVDAAAVKVCDENFDSGEKLPAARGGWSHKKEAPQR
jgi:hypothetical protein